MDVCCECCVLSGRGLCDELITRPEESYRLRCVVVFDLEISWMRRPWHTGGSWAINKQTGCVWSRNLVNEEAVAHWGLLGHQQTDRMRYFSFCGGLISGRCRHQKLQPTEQNGGLLVNWEGFERKWSWYGLMWVPNILPSSGRTNNTSVGEVGTDGADHAFGIVCAVLTIGSR